MSESSSDSDIVVKRQQTARPPPIASGINVEKPKFPQYAVYAKRLESFDAWPEYLPVEKDDLVEAGLVYTGAGDSVSCYFCGGGLRNWERGDVPMEEHAKWYPKCPHILLVKGQAYVEKLGRGEKPDEDEPSVRTDAAEARPNYLETVAAQSCVEVGFKREMVQKAIDRFIERYGNSDFSGRDLCEILFEIEDEQDQPTPCVTDNVEDSEVESLGTGHESLTYKVSRIETFLKSLTHKVKASHEFSAQKVSGMEANLESLTKKMARMEAILGFTHEESQMEAGHEFSAHKVSGIEADRINKITEKKHIESSASSSTKWIDLVSTGSDALPKQMRSYADVVKTTPGSRPQKDRRSTNTVQPTYHATGSNANALPKQMPSYADVVKMTPGSGLKKDK